jgi:tRNA 2-selenouridine synthase
LLLKQDQDETPDPWKSFRVVDLESTGGFSTASGSSHSGGMIVLRGLAGSGKTALLGALADAGEQVLDLEALACHRGSAFGGLGVAQPSHAEFARRVREVRDAADLRRPLWIEDEGPFIGSVGVPPDLRHELLTAPAVELRTSLRRRVARLLADYGDVPAGELCAAIARTRGLDRLVAARATAAVCAGCVADAIELVLPAFDAAYRHRMAAASGVVVAVVENGEVRPSQTRVDRLAHTVERLAAGVSLERLDPAVPRRD